MPKLAIAELKSNRVTWINVTHPGSRELAALKRRFHFLDMDLRECPPPFQRPKLVVRPDYLFMILLFPRFDRATKKIKPIEIDFFIGKNFLVSVHDNHHSSLTELWDSFGKTKGKRGFLAKNPAELLYELLDTLLDSCFPMLVHLANEIDTVENHMSDVHNRDTIRKIFRLKTNIVNFKKCMQPHKSVIRKLIAAAPTFFPTKVLSTYFQHLVEHTKEIWDNLETSAETLDAIEDSHMSLLNFRANDIVRILTIFAVIVFPLTLIAAIFGMNTTDTPIVGNPLDFWIIIGLMSAGTLGMIIYFRWKKWL
ncbi:MAG: magnesium transporter CorA family protein [bacterium]|nr:magnesium transporter CorA family protein [bacterium]